jgi:hypothetical protein
MHCFYSISHRRGAERTKFFRSPKIRRPFPSHELRVMKKLSITISKQLQQLRDQFDWVELRATHPWGSICVRHSSSDCDERFVFFPPNVMMLRQCIACATLCITALVYLARGALDCSIHECFSTYIHLSGTSSCAPTVPFNRCTHPVVNLERRSEGDECRPNGRVAKIRDGSTTAYEDLVGSHS